MIDIEFSHEPTPDEAPLEIVERKGIGHPDTMCDSIMEAASLALSREYLTACGHILHHNLDKGLLAAGSISLEFGGGKMLRPMELFIGDRATVTAGKREIPVEEICRSAAREWVRRNLRFVDPDRDIQTRIVLAPGSAELQDIFQHGEPLLGANDTSAAVGYWPLTQTEQTVLDLEHYLNSGDFKERFPETGEDVKVMAIRRGHDLAVTVAMPLISRFVESEEDYFRRKKMIFAAIGDFHGMRNRFHHVEVAFNTLDRPGRGINGVYLTLTGTSAEDADSGQVGRGNRVNGIIAVCRPLGTEAAAGKNPVSHVGKIYNILSHRLARMVVEEVEGVRAATVFLVSRIGERIDRPAAVNLKLQIVPRVPEAPVFRAASGVVERELAGIGDFCLELARGKYRVC